VLEFAVYSAPTFRHSVETAFRYVHLMNEAADFRIEVAGEQARCVLHSTVPLPRVAIDFPVPDSIAVVESSLGRADLQNAIDGLIESGALDVTLNNLESANSIRSQVLAEDRARGLLTIGETVLVVLLAAAGFYGTQRYLVAVGRREYAIRASLGAGPSALSRLVFKRGLLLGLPGLLLSLPLVFILVSWLYKEEYVRSDYSVVSVTLIVAAVAMGLLVLMTAASIGPSLQARRTQPAPLLREE
jgi:ABC-type antimicrobial peptide transport system permease subunit